jgi:hypothetical protein
VVGGLEVAAGTGVLVEGMEVVVGTEVVVGINVGSINCTGSQLDTAKLTTNVLIIHKIVFEMCLIASSTFSTIIICVCRILFRKMTRAALLACHCERMLRHLHRTAFGAVQVSNLLDYRGIASRRLAVTYA